MSGWHEDARNVMVKGVEWPSDMGNPAVSGCIVMPEELGIEV